MNSSIASSIIHIHFSDQSSLIDKIHIKHAAHYMFGFDEVIPIFLTTLFALKKINK